MANAVGNLSFENVLTKGAFNVDGHVHFIETGGAGGFGADLGNLNAVQTDEDVTIRFHWTQTGALCGMLSGTWRCDVFLEEMGPGEVTSPIPFKTSAFVTTNGFTYEVNVPVAAGTVQEGLYRVTARLMLTSNGAPKLSPVCAFVDLGLVQFVVA
jgi:hypothetical protein